MDTQLVTWEMNLEPAPVLCITEGLALSPMEPYVLDPARINWN